MIHEQVPGGEKDVSVQGPHDKPQESGLAGTSVDLIHQALHPDPFALLLH
jgi:hypothetical protein